MNIAFLQKTIGHDFADKSLLKEALTHRSYLNESPAAGVSHNERLEFLGDAVLELVVTEELFNRFPQKEEGELTIMRSALVNYQMLAQIGWQIGLENFILLSRGEAKDTGRAREVILANALEALIGALYLDGGLAAAKQFVNQRVLSNLDSVLKNGLKDAKSLLQEKVQANLKLTPVYKVLEERGPEHDKVFKIGVYFGSELTGSGEGPSKQEAELEAAKKALEKI